MNDMSQRIHHVNGRHYVAGNSGTAYELSVRNLTPNRIEVVNTVDGRNTLKDEPGSPTNRGMVVPGYGLWTIKGYRLSDATIRKFLFGTPTGSIAEQATGSVANVGIIGFAVYREKHYDDGLVTAVAPPAIYRGVRGVASASLSTEQSSLGTHMGEQVYDPVTRTSFDREGDPDVLVIEYDTYEHLRDRGIIQPDYETSTTAPRPNPFPGSTTGYEHYRVG